MRNQLEGRLPRGDAEPQLAWSELCEVIEARDPSKVFVPTRLAEALAKRAEAGYSRDNDFVLPKPF